MRKLPVTVVSVGLLVAATALVAPSVQAQPRAAPPPGPPTQQVELADPLPLPVTGSVEVSNLPATREPVMITDFVTCPTNGFGCQTGDLYTVPDGKVLTIESVSFLITTNSTEPDVVAPFVSTVWNGTGVQFEIGAFSETARLGGSTGVMAISQNLTLYASPGTGVGAGYLRERGSSGQFDYTISVDISGYLEPVG